MLRALGATDAGLLAIYVTQGLVLAAGGWIIGAALGYPLGALFTKQLERVLFTLSLRISLQSLLQSALAAALLALLASIAPALTAAHVGIRDSLRYE